MKRYALALLFLALAVTVPAFAQDQTAGWLRTQCLKAQTANDTSYGAGSCDGYILGSMMAAQGMAVYDFDTGKTSLVVFTKDGISVGQAERVFLLYISAHPADENKPAHDTFTKALVDANLVWLAKPPVSITKN